MPGSAKVTSSGEANTSNASSEATSRAYNRAKSLSCGAKIALSGEANASNAYGKAKLASPNAKLIAFKKRNLVTKAKSKASQGAIQPKGKILQSPWVQYWTGWVQLT